VPHLRFSRRRRVELLVALVIVVGLLLAALIAGGREESPAAAVAERGHSDAGERAKSRSQPEPEPSPERAGSSGEWPAKPRETVGWRSSKAIGSHSAGRLERGVLLPAEGRAWTSWDPILKRRPNREWRRWGTDRLVRTTLEVLREFGRDHPNAPRVAVGDLSRPRGGDFGPQFGSIGHASHQNGLDIDVYYPRKDRRVRSPKHPAQVNMRLAQDLVDRFVEAGAEKVFVGPNLPLKGPAEVVVPLVHHDNHLHARLPLD
jgi:hypothetical protein